MINTRYKKAKEIQNEIRNVLYRAWDPFNVCDAGPKDEYDSCIGVVYRLLVSGASREAIARQLADFENGSIIQDKSRKEVLLRVADQLLSIDVRIKE